MDLHFDCFYYHVSDMERAVSFYRDILGLQLASRDQVARFEIDGVLFELVPGTRVDRIDMTEVTISNQGRATTLRLPNTKAP